jgi:hypothetical protein
MIDEKGNLATLRTIDTTPQGFEGVVFVQGHTSAGDGGAGIFEWVANPVGTPPPNGDDDGTWIKPNNYTGSGRWIRQVDVRGPFHAEWFGAKGDGATDDAAAIGACLTRFGKVSLLAKTYVVKSPLTLSAGGLAEGQGVDKTTVKNQTPEPTPQVYRKVAAFTGNSPDNAAVRDMTIDCWFTESSEAAKDYTTRQAVSLVGTGIVVERVKAVNFGVGYNRTQNDPNTTLTGGECFVISAVNPPGNPKGNTVSECLVTAAGTRSSQLDIPSAKPIPEITCLSTGGAGHLDLALGGSIRRNRVYDIPYAPNETGARQYSTPHAITVSNCNGTEIAENEIVNCDGVGIYIGSWTDEKVVIRDNRMVGINVGVALGVVQKEIDQKLYPSHTGTQILQNLILLGQNKQTSSMQGVSFYVDNITDPAVRLRDISVRRNYIKGTRPTGAAFVPVGVNLNLNKMVFENIHIEDNILEIPDPDDRTLVVGGTSYPMGFNAAYENCIMFAPDGNYFSPAHGVYPGPGDEPTAWSKVKVHGNRNLAGTDMRLKVVRYGSVTPSDPPRRFWAPFSQRNARFRAPSFGGRAGVFYDEFIGTLPRSALGWTSAVANQGSVNEGTPDGSAPGVVAVNIGTAAAGEAALRLANASFVLANSASVIHIIEFRAARSSGNAPGEDYECALGLRNAGETDAIWFRASQTGGEAFLPYTRVNGTDISINPNNNMKSWGPGDWYVFRLELIPYGTKLEARFFMNWRWLGSAWNDGSQTQIPAGPLELAFRARRLAPASGGADRSLLVDYAQHQIVRV